MVAAHYVTATKSPATGYFYYPVQVLKHKDVEEYYSHMLYPLTLYGAQCSGSQCQDQGKFLTYDPAAIGVGSPLSVCHCDL